MITDIAPLPGYPEPYATLCAVLQDGTKEWRGELDKNMPDEAVNWQPHPNAPSIAHLMLHIIGVEIVWFENRVLKKDWVLKEMETFMLREIDVDSDTWPEVPPRPLSWYLERHDEIRERTLEGIKSWPPPETPVGEGEYQDTARWVLGHVIQHEAYHGGQIVLLQRLYRWLGAG